MEKWLHVELSVKRKGAQREYDMMMREAFGDEYYGAPDVDENFEGYDELDLEKPDFDEEDDEIKRQSLYVGLVLGTCEFIYTSQGALGFWHGGKLRHRGYLSFHAFFNLPGNPWKNWADYSRCSKHDFRHSQGGGCCEICICDQEPSSSEYDLRERYADGMLFCALKECPLCGGGLDFSSGSSLHRQSAFKSYESQKTPEDSSSPWSSSSSSPSALGSSDPPTLLSLSLPGSMELGIDAEVFFYQHGANALTQLLILKYQKGKWKMFSRRC